MTLNGLIMIAAMTKKDNRCGRSTIPSPSQTLNHQKGRGTLVLGLCIGKQAA